MAALALLYLACAIHGAAQAPFWMDEVLAYFAATRPDMAGVWRAIWLGTDFSPPTFHWLLHSLPGLKNHGLIVARLPGILGLLGAALCMAGIARRQVTLPWACLAFAITLTSPLFEFAAQARPYGLLGFCLALTLWLWSGLSAVPRLITVIGMWAALALALSLHFYGVVLIGAIVLCESLWSWQNRAVRMPVWASFAALAPVFLAWLPLARHLHTISAADQVGLGFYGHPTLERLALIYAQLFGGGPLQMLVYGGVVLASLLGSKLRTTQPQPSRSTDHTGQASIVLIGLAAIPLGAFALAIVATGSIMPRYAAAASLLPGLGLAVMLGRRHYPDWVALLPLPLIALVSIWQSHEQERGRIIAAAAQVVTKTPADMPIATGDGELYLELAAALPTDQQNRLAYIAAPPGDQSPDPTNEREVQRLASINRQLRLWSFAEATAPGQTLNILHSVHAQTDMARARIRSWKLPSSAIAGNGLARIDQVEIPAHALQANHGNTPR